ncbi:MAG: glycosyltransferase, partial [Candidatus Caldarchaeum sp.]
AERLPAWLSTKIICVSEYDRQLALRFQVASREKLVVIPNGLEPEPFRAPTERRALRVQLGASDAVGIVTMVGRLAPPKDFETLITAWEGLKAPGWQLWIVGEGPLRLRLEELVHAKGLDERIKFLGERRDVPDILKASDIFVLTSRWEGMPLTLIEAMLAGLPVIATRVGGVPELVEDGVTGLLVPPKDALTLRSALERLLSSAETRQRMGEAGRHRALEHFTVEQMINRVRVLYHDLERERDLG